MTGSPVGLKLRFFLKTSLGASYGWAQRDPASCLEGEASRTGGSGPCGGETRVNDFQECKRRTRECTGDGGERRGRPTDTRMELTFSGSRENGPEAAVRSEEGAVPGRARLHERCGEKTPPLGRTPGHRVLRGQRGPHCLMRKRKEPAAMRFGKQEMLPSSEGPCLGSGTRGEASVSQQRPAGPCGAHHQRVEEDLGSLCGQTGTGRRT